MTRIFKDTHLLITTANTLYKISIKDILYVEKIKNSKKISIITSSDKIDCIGTISEIYSLLSDFDSFYKISQSVILNLEHIYKIDAFEDCIVLDKKIKLYFSDRIIKTLLNDVYGQYLETCNS